MSNSQNIRAFSFANLGAKFIPVQGSVMGELPYTNSGKTIRKALAEE